MANDDKKNKEQQLRTLINQKLVESGEKDRLKELLRTKLSESGWREEMKQQCKEYIRKKGVDNVTMEELVQELLPKGRSSIPPSVKQELVTNLRKFLTTVVR